MPTSYTSLIGLALPVTGELSGTWGDTVNNYITNYLDSAVAGTQTISGTQTAVTLSVTNGSSLVTAGSGSTGSAQFQIINCTGNPAGLLTITAPASSRQYIIINATSTSQSVKIVGAGPTTGVTILSGEKAHVAWNGSDFVKIATQSGNGSFVDLTVSGSMTLSGGTANGVLYLNGSKVATSGSALTFDGTKLGVASGNIDVVSASFVGSPLIAARFNASNLRMGIGIGNSNGFPFLGVNVNNAANDNGTFDIANWASRIRLDNGVFQVQTSTASGAAGGAITWSTPLYLDSSGNLGIGTSSPTGKLQIKGTVNFEATNSTNVWNLYTYTDNTLRWNYNGAGADELVLDSSGNLGLRVTPSGWSSTFPALQIGQGAAFWAADNYPYAYMSSNSYYDGTNSKYITTNYASWYVQEVGSHKWFNAPSGTAGNNISFTQAMTLDASGNLLVGTTSSVEGALFCVSFNGSAVPGVTVADTSAVATANMMFFHKNGAVRGSIQSTSTATSFNTSSDRRLKQNIVSAPSASDDIDAIRIVSHDWKDAPDEHVTYGVIAQDLHAVAPQAVSVGDDGDEIKRTWGVDYSKLVPMLIKEIQSLRARVAQLESKGA